MKLIQKLETIFNIVLSKFQKILLNRPQTVDTKLYWFHVGKFWKEDQKDNRKVEVNI